MQVRSSPTRVCSQLFVQAEELTDNSPSHALHTLHLSILQLALYELCVVAIPL
jgi:hypothetical protein